MSQQQSPGQKKSKLEHVKDVEINVAKTSCVSEMVENVVRKNEQVKKSSFIAMFSSTFSIASMKLGIVYKGHIVTLLST